MLNSKNKFTILVNSCDAYKDVWPLFFAALDDYWPGRNVDIVLNTESSQKDLSNMVRVSSCNDDICRKYWGARFINALESVETDFIVVLYDDFILESQVDAKKINSLVAHMVKNTDIAVHYLTNVCPELLQDEDGGNQQILMKNGIEYRLNSSPALWRKSDLISYIGVYDTPWAWEVFGSYRTYIDNKKFYTPKSFLNNSYNYAYKKGGAIYRGKWVSSVVKDKIKKYKLNIDLQQRGISAEGEFEPRSLKWKVDFMILGYRMVGIKSLLFIYRYIKIKLKV